MKILVCGVTGFMGRNIYEHFKTLGFDVWGCARRISDDFKNDPKILSVDLTNTEEIQNLFLRILPTVVIQAAATTSGSKDILSKPYIHVTDNAVMNSLLLRACHDYDVKHFLFLSCCVMYQPNRSYAQIEDDFKLDEPIYKSYFGVGWTKVYIEKMCEFYSRLGKVKCTVIRHTNTYGPYDKYDPDHSHVFGATIRKVMAATDKVVVWGKGEEERDLLYVSDVVKAVEILIAKQTIPFEVVNVSYGTVISVCDLVNKIVKTSGKSLEIEHDLSAPSIPTKLAISSSHMKNMYGWEPQISIDEGIKLTLDWYKKWIL